MTIATIVLVSTVLPQTRVLQPETQYRFDRTLRIGSTKKIQEGKKGSEELVSGKWVTKVPSEPNVIAVHPGLVPLSRGSFNRSKLMRVKATAYLPHEGSSKGLTATGRKATFGIIAVDPRVIPLGSYVYVEGYGMSIAADTGGAIKGNIIDVCFLKRGQMNSWGVKYPTIHVFKEKAFNWPRRKR